MRVWQTGTPPKTGQDRQDPLLQRPAAVRVAERSVSRSHVWKETHFKIAYIHCRHSCAVCVPRQKTTHLRLGDSFFRVYSQIQPNTTCYNLLKHNKAVMITLNPIILALSLAASSLALSSPSLSQPSTLNQPNPAQLLLNPAGLASALLSSPLSSALLNPGFCAVPHGSIDDACGATYDAVEQTNHRVGPVIKSLVTTDFFRFYYLDLFSDDNDNDNKCPLSEQGTCGNRACAVDTVDDEDELPEIWRASSLGKLGQDSVSAHRNKDSAHQAASCLTDQQTALSDKNYCVPEDDLTATRHGAGVYVSLLDNPERYTGYGGPHAHMIWRNVYQQNCFGYTGPSISKSFLEGEEPMAEATAEAGAESRDMTESAGQCIEQRLFYRLVSGMHSSVSTHLCYSYLDKSTGLWGPNADCFLSRVGNHPERLANLYFNYAVVARAVAKLFGYIDDIKFCENEGPGAGHDDHFCPDSKSSETQATRRLLLHLSRSVSANAISASPPSMFDETLLFSTPEARLLKEQFRQQFRRVSQLMECVGCDRCRLWGKLQAAGYGTALKIVFELDEVKTSVQGDDDDRERVEQSRKLISSLRRSELVALINTFDRLSKSIEAVEYFRNFVKDGLKKEGIDVGALQEGVMERDAVENTGRGQMEETKQKRRRSVSGVELANGSNYEYEYGNEEEEEDYGNQHSKMKLSVKKLKGFLQSYTKVSKNVYDTGVSYLNRYWNVLAGKPGIGNGIGRGRLETLNAEL